MMRHDNIIRFQFTWKIISQPKKSQVTRRTFLTIAFRSPAETMRIDRDSKYLITIAHLHSIPHTLKPHFHESRTSEIVKQSQPPNTTT